jgi:hypothetical protein
MHSHNIALALADARVADLQRPATHSTATVTPRRQRRHLRALALLGLAATAALAAFAPTGALAQPTHDAATPANAPAAKIGDTPADFAQPVAPAPKLGDTPADHPGASRAPQYDPPRTITVNRPQRTIVRNADQLLPITLASVALLLALAGLATTLTRTRMQPRPSRS